MRGPSRHRISRRKHICHVAVYTWRLLTPYLGHISATWRQEYFSREPRHEIVLLNDAECGQLRPDVAMCGRHPHLRACTDDDHALRGMATCRRFNKKEFSPRVRRSVRSLSRFMPNSRCSHSPCHLRGSQYFC